MHMCGQMQWHQLQRHHQPRQRHRPRRHNDGDDGDGDDIDNDDDNGDEEDIDNNCDSDSDVNDTSNSAGHRDSSIAVRSKIRANAYVAVADKQGHKKGLCAGLALLAANCVKFAVLDATRVGFKPAGAFVWGAITAAGALALKA